MSGSYATCLNVLFDNKSLIYYASLTKVNTAHHNTVKDAFC